MVVHVSHGAGGIVKEGMIVTGGNRTPKFQTEKAPTVGVGVNRTAIMREK